MGIISEMIQRGLLSECDVQEYNIATNPRSFNGRIVDDSCLLLFARMDLLDGKAVVPTGITKIAKGAFDGCYSGLQTVVLPETLEEIDDCAFYECGRLTNINMPKSLKRIGNSAFSGTNLTKVALPKGLKEIEDYTFAYNADLTEVKIPQGVTKIGAGAFAYTQLKNINIPSTVNEIGDRAFEDVPLTKVVLPTGIKLGIDAFDKNVEISYTDARIDDITL